ncbi:MAG: 2-oxo acid dehydrogenase subunit E2, partial [Bacteroidales bacterium]|nr:2-oxo acid dehydrogenase subunit E2 [Bacteroidales bacterium]
MTEIILPAMGEGIIDATITKIFKKVGDKVEVDEPVVEVATDKVDSEIVSPVDGIISEIKYKEGDIVEIEQIIAIVLAEGEKAAGFSSKKLKVLKIEKTVKESSLVSNENE